MSLALVLTSSDRVLYSCLRAATVTDAEAIGMAIPGCAICMFAGVDATCIVCAGATCKAEEAGAICIVVGAGPICIGAT